MNTCKRGGTEIAGAPLLSFIFENRGPVMLAVADGLIPVIRLFDLPALNQSFIYALECQQTGNAFVKYSDCHELEAAVRFQCHKAAIRPARLYKAMG